MIYSPFQAYILTVAAILVISTFGYRFLTESKFAPSVNRKIILLIFFLSFIFPFIFILLDDYNILPDIGIGVEAVKDSSKDLAQKNPITEKLTSLSEIGVKIYYIGFLVTGIITLLSLSFLFIVIKLSEIRVIDGKKIYLHHYKSLASFSWCNRIFLYAESINDSPENISLLLQHEQAHIDYRHWLDLIVIQGAIILQWFNPAVWWLRKEMQRIHEYMADEAVLNAGVNKKDYQMFLIKNISGIKYPGIVSGLNNSSLKRRFIKMRKKTYDTYWKFRVCAIIGIALIGSFVFRVPVTGSKTYLLTTNQAAIVENEEEKNETEEHPLDIYLNGQEISYEEMNKINPYQIESIVVRKNSHPYKIEVTYKPEIETTEVVTEEIKVIGVGSIKKNN